MRCSTGNQLCTVPSETGRWSMTRLLGYLAAAFVGTMVAAGAAQTSGSPGKIHGDGGEHVARRHEHGGDRNHEVVHRSRADKTRVDVDGPGAKQAARPAAEHASCRLHPSERRPRIRPALRAQDPGRRRRRADHRRDGPADRILGGGQPARARSTIRSPSSSCTSTRTARARASCRSRQRCIGNKDTNTVLLENYDIQPVLLQSVKREKASH